MGVAAIAGMSWGALHAVAAPDHVLSLAPEAVARPRSAWRIGLWWGAGHALGTLAFAAAAAVLAAALHAERLEGFADRAAGLALVATGLLGLRRCWALHAAAARAAAIASRGGNFAVGVLHGLTGAAALVLALPALAGSGAARWVWLAGFSLGSTAAMAALTAGLAAGARRLTGPLVRLAAPFASGLSVLVGVALTVR
jgi:hypothetical protein